MVNGPDAERQRPVDSSKVLEKEIYNWTLRIQRPVKYSKHLVRV